MKRNIINNKGFTLLEILLVVAAIAILAGIVIIAVNPTKQLGDTRNAQRSADVNTILNAVYQYTIDNNGVLPTSITATSTEICADGVASCGSLIDLSVITDDETYLVGIPSDPQCPDVCDADGVGYTISRSVNGRITVSAPDAEQGATIEAVR